MLINKLQYNILFIVRDFLIFILKNQDLYQPWFTLLLLVVVIWSEDFTICIYFTDG